MDRKERRSRKSDGRYIVFDVFEKMKGFREIVIASKFYSARESNWCHPEKKKINLTKGQASRLGFFGLLAGFIQNILSTQLVGY
jgi:hypothetical protein